MNRKRKVVTRLSTRASRKQSKNTSTTQRRAAKKQDSAQEYSPLLADFIAKTDVLLSVCEIAKRGNVSLKSHSYYAAKGRTAWAELQYSFEALTAGHPSDQFPTLEGHIEVIQEDMDAFAGSFPSDVPKLVKCLKRIKLIASTDLHVALKALGASAPKMIVVTKEFIPEELLEHHETPYQKILHEVNVCYEAKCYNGAAILIRRIVESLLILAFESKGIGDRIRDGDGNYHMLKGLINATGGSPELNLGRIVKNGLPKSKFFGDLGAHNPRALVRKADLDSAHELIRVSVEELAGISARNKLATA